MVAEALLQLQCNRSLPFTTAQRLVVVQVGQDAKVNVRVNGHVAHQSGETNQPGRCALQASSRRTRPSSGATVHPGQSIRLITCEWIVVFSTNPVRVEDIEVLKDSQRVSCAAQGPFSFGVRACCLEPERRGIRNDDERNMFKNI